MAYDAFVSYSHAADGRLAPALQQSMQRLAKPWYRPRALRVFRDESALSTNPHLWSSIEAALDETGWFVLLASPEAARSDWVNRELDHWLQTKAADRILVVLTAGALEWEPNTSTLIGDALPAALQSAFTDEPRHLDMRWAHDETDLDLRNSRFRDAVAQLAAPMHGLAKDDLESEDIRQHRHTRRLARGAVSMLALLLALAVAFGGYAFVQRNRANKAATEARNEARESDASRLAVESENIEGASLSRALLLAVEAHRLDDTPETRSALLASVQQSPRLVAMLDDFGSQIGGMALTPDGRTIVIGGFDGKVRIVDRETRQLERTWPTGHQGRILSVSVSPNGKMFATTGIDGTARFFDLRTGRTAAPMYRDPDHPPLDTAGFSPDGKLFFASSHLEYVDIWIVATGKSPFVSAEGPASTPLSDKDRSVPTFTRDGTAIIEPSVPPERDDVRTGKSTLLQSDDGEPPRAVVASPVDNTIALIRPASVEIVDPTSGKQVSPEFSVHAGWGGAFSPDGKRLAVSAQDGSIQIFSVATGAKLGDALAGHSNAAGTVAFTPDGKTLVSASTSEVAIWDLNGTASISRVLGSDGPAGSVSRSDGPVGGGYGLAVTPDGTRVLTGQDAGLNVWSTRANTSQLYALHEKHGYGTMGVAIDPTGNEVLTGGSDGLVVLSDLATGRILHPPLHAGPPSPKNSTNAGAGTWGTAFSPDGRLGAVGTGAGTIVIVDIRHWRVLRTIHAHTPGFVIGIAFSPSGTLVASNGSDGLAVDDVATGRQRYGLSHSSSINGGVAFSPDGRQLAAGFGDGTAQLFDARTGDLEGPPLVFNRGIVGGVAYSPDGGTIAMGQGDGSIFLVDARSRQSLGAPLTGHAGQVVGLAFMRDGQHLASTGFDGTVRVWNLDTASEVARACVMAGRNLTHAEWSQYVPRRAYAKECVSTPS